ncbi:hypothetical protein M758_1G318800 [Ceratodon purpureus]|uniref:Uncharacterized protein n=1 Tax=Ceratodon purpureus TaxID=3225 RepID=A0A8T0JET8_CERPU|nr:hypothetical protein KC19_1G326000 [Ceratodon purpureus]KAG0632306.1 hypothetical protein M758_1G318800 [Ceratodon purpureus]
MPMMSPAPTPSPHTGDGMDAASTTSSPALLLLHSTTPISFIPLCYSSYPSLIFGIAVSNPLRFPLDSHFGLPHSHAFHFHVTAAYFRSLLHCLPVLAVGQRLFSLSLSLSRSQCGVFHLSSPV